MGVSTDTVTLISCWRKYIIVMNKRTCSSSISPLFLSIMLKSYTSLDLACYMSSSCVFSRISWHVEVGVNTEKPQRRKKITQAAALESVIMPPISTVYLVIVSSLQFQEGFFSCLAVATSNPRTQAQPTVRFHH